jgi:hypothetical protein
MAQRLSSSPRSGRGTTVAHRISFADARSKFGNVRQTCPHLRHSRKFSTPEFWHRIPHGRIFVGMRQLIHRHPEFVQVLKILIAIDAQFGHKLIRVHRGSMVNFQSQSDAIRQPVRDDQAPGILSTSTSSKPRGRGPLFNSFESIFDLPLRVGRDPIVWQPSPLDLEGVSGGSRWPTANSSARNDRVPSAVIRHPFHAGRQTPNTLVRAPRTPRYRRIKACRAASPQRPHRPKLPAPSISRSPQLVQ